MRTTVIVPNAEIFEKLVCLKYMKLQDLNSSLSFILKKNVYSFSFYSI